MKIILKNNILNQKKYFALFLHRLKNSQWRIQSTRYDFINSTFFTLDHYNVPLFPFLIWKNVIILIWKNSFMVRITTRTNTCISFLETFNLSCTYFNFLLIVIFIKNTNIFHLFNILVFIYFKYDRINNFNFQV